MFKHVKILVALFLSISGITSLTAQDNETESLHDQHQIHEHYQYDHDTVIYNDPNDSLHYFRVENLGTNVNSEHLESGPRISPDGKTLYFFSAGRAENKDPFYQDIWFSKLMDDDSTWGPAQHLADLNNFDHNGIHWISQDGKRVLLLNEYLPNGESSNGVSMSELNEDGTWKEPKPLKIKGRYKNKMPASFFLNAEENILIMAIHGKKDTVGKQDFYYSTLKSKKGIKTKWNKPKLMGTVLNSPGSEATAFLHADGKTMYFSSNGHPGSLGGFDIYKSTRLDSTWENWSTPENIGKPYNTYDDEFYFSLPANCDYAYLSHHFKTSDTTEHSDIVRIKPHEIIIPDPVLTLTGRVFSLKDSLPIAATITVREKGKDEDFLVYEVDPTEPYFIQLPGGPEYELIIEADDHKSSNIVQRTDDMEETFEEREMDIYLFPVDPPTIEIPDIFFEYNDSTLLPESFPSLDKVVDLLSKNTSVRVEISGHTDSRGSDRYNQKLSQGRASSVVKYLVEKGIGQDRLVPKGYGEQQLRNGCKNGITCSDEQHKINRRVEMQPLKDEEEI